MLSCLSRRAHGEGRRTGANHNGAATLLKSADPDSAPRLSVLLGMKTRAGYSQTPATPADATRAMRAAQHLVQTARALVGGA